ncbi:MAG: hypothetical protein PHD03_04980 [Bacilli bacterium]|nr:hypothetical protein [Bacilli bacterium]
MKNILIKNGYIYQDNNVIKKDILIINKHLHFGVEDIQKILIVKILI